MKTFQKIVTFFVAAAVLATSALAFEITPSVEKLQSPRVVRVYAGDEELSVSTVTITGLGEKNPTPEAKASLAEAVADIKKGEEGLFGAENSTLLKAWNTTTGNLPLENVAIAEVFDVALNDVARKALEKAGSITIEFRTENLGLKTPFILGHKMNGEWIAENNVRRLLNSNVRMTITDVSPFVFITVKKGVEVGPGAVESPATGEGTNGAAIACAAVFTAAAAVFCVKALRKEND